jgi:tRNA uridine 5-carboxymethylaminomethyl modification enzyme
MEKDTGETENLHIWQEEARLLIMDGFNVKGVETAFGTRFLADVVILTNGTFLNGLMHVGFRNINGGRSGVESFHRP